MTRHRIFIEKKAGFGVDEAQYGERIRRITPCAGVRTFIIYDIFGLTRAGLAAVLPETLVDTVTDKVYWDKADLRLEETYFSVAYLPGQYDARAYWAEQSLSLMTQQKDITVRSGLLVELQGMAKPEDLALVKKEWINPVDSCEKDLSVLSLEAGREAPPVLVYPDFIDWNAEQLTAFHRAQRYAFDAADLAYIQAYFKKEKRNPTQTELSLLDVYWSDHCRHTTFETELTEVLLPEGSRVARIFADYVAARAYLGKSKYPITLMDMATIGAKTLIRKEQLKDIVISSEVNACTLSVTVSYDNKQEDWYLLFKNETHNHPTEIEPFGGAATCLGGAIRDVLSGRGLVYQAMRLSGAGAVWASETLPGKLPQYLITTQAAKGFSSYGNQIGVATSLVDELYHPGYVAKRMEVGFVMGALPQESVRREEPKAGDRIVLLGGPTGRDGIGGASGSSQLQEGVAQEALSAQVQKGDPLIERKLQRLFRKPQLRGLIKKCNDLGAGGIAVGVGELADALRIDLDEVPLKYEGLNAAEISISESQERMAVVIAPEDWTLFQRLCVAEDVSAHCIGEITDSGYLEFCHQGVQVLRIARSFLKTNGLVKRQRVCVSDKSVPKLRTLAFSKDNFYRLLGDKNSCSKKGLVELFDATVGGTTVLAPLGGKYQLTPAEGSVHIFPVPDAQNVQTVSAATWGFDPYLSAAHPAVGGAFAVAEALLKLTALGVDYRQARLSCQEYFPKLKDESDWGEAVMALLGIYEAQMRFGTPAIGGKDSMSGTYRDLEVPPTAIVFAVATGDIRHIIAPEFKKAGHSIYHYAHQPDGDGFPDYAALQAVMSFISAHIQKGVIVSAKTVGRDGPAVALAKMCMGNGLGAVVQTEADLLAEGFGSIIVESNAPLECPFFQKIGTVSGAAQLVMNVQGFALEELQAVWTAPLEGVFPTMAPASPVVAEGGVSIAAYPVVMPVKKAVPQVFIPVFPGTNCEYESAALWQQNGARVVEAVMQSGALSEIEQTLRHWQQQIDRSQILMLSGGFSAGDEPDGSAKFMVNILRHSLIKSSIEHLLHRGGLILGICNGFQALIKSGLLPYGCIQKRQPSDPTLSFNTIGRHMAQMARVRVVAAENPWLRGMNGQIYTIPVSHGEGRFIANDATLRYLESQKQIGTVYVDAQGNNAGAMPDNPNGSAGAVESLLSPCGQIYGRMGHPERYRQADLFKNIPQIRLHNIFANAVQYFN